MDRNTINFILLEVFDFEENITIQKQLTNDQKSKYRGFKS